LLVTLHTHFSLYFFSDVLQAAAGWPISELFHQKIASFLHLKSLLVDGERVPSLLNGGLQHTNPFYWMGILAVTGLFEGILAMNSDSAREAFDPFKLFPEDEEGQKWIEAAELKNGRLAMLAITTYAIMEAFSHQAVVDSTAFLFHPLF
jgi:Chlorophyll A-B binding protein